MDSDPMNYSELQKKYGGGFVALLEGEVVAHGKTFSDVLEKVKKEGILENENLMFDFIEEGTVCVYGMPQL